MAALFPLGRVVSTPGALAALEAAGTHPIPYVRRHARGDWGDISDEDQGANEESLKDGTRLLSVYTVNDTLAIWIITEADRSATTVLLPEEY